MDKWYCQIDDIQKLYYWTSMIFTFIGLCLGACYFIGRILHENKRDKAERTRKTTNAILDYFHKYNNLVLEILFINFTDESSLKIKQEELRTLYDATSHHLDYVSGSEGQNMLSRRDLVQILKVFSFVDKALFREPIYEKEQAYREYRKLFNAAFPLLLKRVIE